MNTDPAAASRPYIPPSSKGVGRIASPGLSLAFLTIIAAFNTIDRQILTILAAPMKAEFNLSDSQVGLLGLVYGLLFSIGAAPLAALANRTSRRAVIVGCMALFSACTAFCGLAWNYATLVLSRIGVAVGEAGTAAPSQSLIADSYPRERRTFALTIFSAASKPGGFVAFLAGGWLAEWLGWRATFLLLGIPGILIAGIAWFLLKEPPVGASDGKAVSVAQKLPNFRENLRHLKHVPSFWHILIGKGLWSLFTLGLVFWIPHYLHRTHDLGLGVIGTAMGIYTLGIGATGVLTIGWVTQKLQARDVRWLLGVLVVAALTTLPLIWIFLTTQSIWLAALCAIPPVFIYSANLGPTSSAAQAVVPANMRTTTAGLTQVVQGFLGMGMGPFVPGVLSDLLEPRFGDDSLRYALMLLSLLWLWAGAHFLLANRTLQKDIARADAINAGLGAGAAPAVGEVAR